MDFWQKTLLTTATVAMSLGQLQAQTGIGRGQPLEKGAGGALPAAKAGGNPALNGSTAIIPGGDCQTQTRQTVLDAADAVPLRDGKRWLTRDALMSNKLNKSKYKVDSLKYHEGTYAVFYGACGQQEMGRMANVALVYELYDDLPQSKKDAKDNVVPSILVEADIVLMAPVNGDLIPEKISQKKPEYVQLTYHQDTRYYKDTAVNGYTFVTLTYYRRNKEGQLEVTAYSEPGKLEAAAYGESDEPEVTGQRISKIPEMEKRTARAMREDVIKAAGFGGGSSDREDGPGGVIDIYLKRHFSENGLDFPPEGVVIPNRVEDTRPYFDPLSPKK